MKYRKAKNGKSLLLVVSLVLVVTMTVGGTLAYLLDVSGPITNLFTSSQVKTQVTETFENGVKSDVKIQNTGDTTAWIRAAVVVTWQNGQGEIYGQAPGKDDYTITYGTDWLTGDDGFFYHKTPVDAGEKTGALIHSCTYTANAPDGYFLCVEIVCSGLQSKPASVFNTNWASSGLKVDDAGPNLAKK